MNRLKRILVAVDFSAGAQTALTQAVRLADLNRARLWVMHCVDASLLAELSQATGRPQAELSRKVTGQAEQLMTDALHRAGAPADAKWWVDCDVPIEAVRRRHEQVRPDLLVLGAVGAAEDPTGVGPFATRCLRKIDTKVMLVAPRQRRPLRRIVAGIDFSPTARSVLAQAGRVAAFEGGDVAAVHVFLPPWRRFGFRMNSPADSVAFAAAYAQRLMRKLREFVGEIPGVPVTCHLIEAADRGRALADFATRRKAHLVIVGRRGLTNLKYVLLGSTAELLARNFAGSLLVIPPAPAADHAS
jgi:nucleotide-binding universal stress UspA family protein